MKHALLISAILLACAVAASPALCIAISTPDTKTEQLQMIGDYADSNKANNTFAAHGNVRVSITGQDAILEADDVLVDLNSATIDARGHVRITRHNELTTGSAFKFRISSNEYLITTSTTQVTGPSLSSRIGSGKPVEGQMDKAPAARVSHAPANFSLASHVTFAPSDSNYYGEGKYLPNTWSNKQFRPGHFIYSDQDLVRLPFGRFRKPSSFLFTDWKFGTWKPVASKSSIGIGSRVYGLKTPPKDLLPAMLLPNEQQSRPRKPHRNLSSLALTRALRFSNEHKTKTG